MFIQPKLNLWSLNTVMTKQLHFVNAHAIKALNQASLKNFYTSLEFLKVDL